MRSPRAIPDPTRRAAHLAALAACLIAAGAALAGPATWQVVAGEGTKIVFTSKAPLETFQGRTGQVGGWCRFDPDDLAAGVELAVDVDLASFDTGLSKRNQHMRENHLETGRFPRAELRGGTLRAAGGGALPASLPPGGSVKVMLDGSLDLHGVTRPLTAEVTLVRGDGDALAVEAAFIVRLEDHAIERPKFLVMKLADEQAVTAHLDLERQP
ncbi:MAG TPA: YceI family protein [Candidatus Krumholzibacteria bacterium]|nr:YceI family protein [Candidatus Krumholzibacteria bacterium]